MKRKLFELKNTRATQITAAETALKAGDNAAYDAAMQEVGMLNGEIDRVEKLLGEQARYAGKPEGPAPEAPAAEQPENSERSRQLKDLRGSNEYANAFFKALRLGARPDSYVEACAPLYKAMSIAGGSPEGADGGFLVPIDFETKVRLLSKDYVNLAAYAHTETVNVVQGWRNIETSAGRAPLPLVEEDAVIPMAAQPTFRRVNFSCKKYGDRLGISGELMQNADGLLSYLAEWWTPRYVATKNARILELLNALEFAAITGATDAAKVKAVKSVLNKDLITAHSRRASLITNANGYDDMDGWVDGNERPYLKPDVSGDFDRFKGRPVVYGDIDIIPDITVESKTYAPLYIGNLAAFAAIFERSGMAMDSTNIGGDAWAKGGWEIRVLCSLDCQQIDPAAMVKRGLAQA